MIRPSSLSNGEIIYDLPEAEYHSLPRLSSTWAKNATQYSPAHADTMNVVSPSEAMANGSMFHLLMFEPERFEQLVVEPPDVDFRKKDDKARACSWVEMKTGKELPPECQNKTGFISFLAGCGLYACDQEKLDLLHGAKAALENHDLFPSIWQPGDDGRNEASVLFNIHGAPCKARIDRLTPAGMIDLKTARCASPRDFPRAFYSMRYFVQAAMYFEALRSAGVEPDGVYYVAVELAKPHGVGFFKVSEADLDLGLDVVYQAVELWKNHSRETPLGYRQDLIQLCPPRWVEDAEGLRTSETMPLIGEEL